MVMGNYYPQVDIVTFTFCIILKIISAIVYSKSTKRYKYLNTSLTLLCIAAFSNTLLNYCFVDKTINTLITSIAIYLIKSIYFISLTSLLFIFYLYIYSLLDLSDQIIKKVMTFCYFVFCALYLILPLFKYDFYITSNGTLVQDGNLNVFAISYFLCMLQLLSLLLKNNIIIAKKISNCIFLVFFISVLTIFIEVLYNTSTYTCFTFLMPIVTTFILFHKNSYDVDFCSLDFSAFLTYYTNFKKKNKKRRTIQYSICNIYVKDFSKSMYTRQLRLDFIKFCEDIHYRNFTFKISDNSLLFIYKNNNLDTKTIQKAMDELYINYKLDYRITIIPFFDALKTATDFVNFCKFMYGKTNINTVNFATFEDLDAYTTTEYIKSELLDIAKKKDSNDSRVLTFVQPVYNVNEKNFDCAEALMRLKLEKVGIIVPDNFIPLAEDLGIIHILSEIILNKVCMFLEKNTDIVSRISVNFSILEVLDDNFCTDIINIISNYNIDYSKIAIEITESRAYKDFKSIKQKIIFLKKLGFKFYLDDFGTGYSNFDRILELPIDIIKFDKSLLTLSYTSKKCNYMVVNFSDIFKKIGYLTLFEGVETKDEESFCFKMQADYLQGYLYSKPIPIEKLNEFLENVK